MKKTLLVVGLLLAYGLSIAQKASSVVSTYAGSGNRSFADGRASSAAFNFPEGIAVDKAGNVYVADPANNRIRKIDLNGMVSTYAGNGTAGYANGRADTAQFNEPNSVAVDDSGNVYVGERSGYRLRKILTTGFVITLSGNGTPGYLDGKGSNARFSGFEGLAVDKQGNVYVADAGSNLIRKVSPTGATTTFSGSGFAYNLDGPPNVTCFNNPVGLAVDKDGNVYVADQGNYAIRKLNPGGFSSTLAGRIDTTRFGYADGPARVAKFGRSLGGLAVDSLGFVYVVDKLNQVIRKIDQAGNTSTLAGVPLTNGNTDGPGIVAKFYSPSSIASNGAGLLFLSDTRNNTIRKITQSYKFIATGFSPKKVKKGDTITIKGVGLDSVRTISLGGITDNPFTRVNDSTISIVADSAFSGNISVSTDSGVSILPGFVFCNLTRPVITASNSSLCTGDSLQLTARLGFASYIWSTGQNTSSIWVKKDSTYYVQVVSFEGCTSDSSAGFVVSKRNAPAKPGISGNTGFCAADSTILTASPGFSRYLWSNGDTSQSIRVKQVGNYSVKVWASGACGYSHSDTLSVSQYPTIPAFSVTKTGNSNFCGTDSVLLTAPSGFAHYLWSNGDTTLTTKARSARAYAVWVTNQNGCKALSDSIRFSHKPAIASTTTGICTGDSAKLSGPDGFAGYRWSNGDTTQSIWVKATGTYYLRTIALSGCLSDSSAGFAVYSKSTIAKPTFAGGTTLNVCSNDSLKFSPVLTYDKYKWSTGDTTASIYVKTPGKYFVTVSSKSFCGQATSDSVTITRIPALPVPVVTTNHNSTFCAKDSVILAAPVDTSHKTRYLWSTGDTTQTTKIKTVGTYYLTIISRNGCKTKSAPVVFDHLPVITANGPLSFCQGGTVTLSGPAGFNKYRWGAKDSTTGRNIIIAKDTTIWLQVKNANGCWSDTSLHQTIKVTPKTKKPKLITSGPVIFCAGDSLICEAPAGYTTYAWNTGDSTRTIVVKTTKRVYVKVTKDSTCGGAKYSDTINAQVLPIITPPVISFANNSNFCNSDTVVLKAPPGYASYLWSNGSTADSTKAGATGTYTVTVKNANGCSRTSLPVVFSAKPIIKTSRIPFICPGDSIILAAPANFKKYLWNTGDTTSFITVKTNGSFTVKTTDSKGCLSPFSDTLNVVVTPFPPKPTIKSSSATANICFGTSVVLSAPDSFATYYWSTGARTRSIIAKVTANYTVQVGNIAGCISPISNAYALAVKPPQARPTIVAKAGTFSYCVGDSAVLRAPTGMAHYVWNTGDTTRQITVRKSGKYNVAVVDIGGCLSDTSKPAFVTFDSIPAKPQITFTGDLTFCQGGSVTLTAPLAPRYRWSTGDTTRNLIVTRTGTYKVAIKTKGGCASDSSLPVSVVAFQTPPLPNITLANLPGYAQTADFCLGDSVRLLLPSGFSKYVWSTGDTTQGITVKTNANVSGLVYAGNCVSPVSNQFLTTASAKPARPSVVVAPGGGITSTVTGTRYVWLLENSVLPGINKVKFKATLPGNYRVIVYNGGCQSDTSAPFFTLGVASEFDNKASLNIAPNPVTGRARITVNGLSAGKVHLSVHSVTGQSVRSETAETNTDSFNHEMDLSELPAGMYIVVIKTGKTVLRQKLEKQ